MKRAPFELWLCEDCTVIAGTGDVSSLDYYYSEKDSAQRLKEIDAGLEALPGLVNDHTDEPQSECTDCGWIGRTSDCERSYNEEFDETETICPLCSTEVRDRDCGQEEFSRRSCDSCGTGLAGTRTRYAQLLPKTPTEGTSLALPG